MTGSIYVFSLIWLDLKFQLTRTMSGYVYRAADSALKLEQERIQKLKELYERNQAIKSSSNKVLLGVDTGDVNKLFVYILHALVTANLSLLLSNIIVIYIY